MSGTMSEKELRINCGSKLCVQVSDEKIHLRIIMRQQWQL